MPVLDHPTHEKTIGGERYGCHGKPRVFIGYQGPDGWIPNTMSTECRYDHSLSDPKCAECKHAGSGEDYAERIMANGK